MSNSNPGRVTKVWPGIEYSNVSIKTTSLSLTLMYVTKLPSRPYSGGTGPANQSKGTVDLIPTRAFVSPSWNLLVWSTSRL